MRAIETRFVPAGNVRGSRIKAVDLATGRSVYVEYTHDKESDHNHGRAVKKLAKKLALTPAKWYPGETKRGYVWVAPGDDYLTA